MFNEYINHYGTKKFNSIGVMFKFSFVCARACVSSSARPPSTMIVARLPWQGAGQAPDDQPTAVAFTMICKGVPAEELFRCNYR